MKKLLLAGCAVLFLATGTARAGDLASYRKPICETAEDFAGCMTNKKPQMWATDGIRWDCRHGFSLTDESGDMGDGKVEFIITITKTPTYKAARLTGNASAVRQRKNTATQTTSAGVDFIRAGGDNANDKAIPNRYRCAAPGYRNSARRR
jgi:hypothetical protein